MRRLLVGITVLTIVLASLALGACRKGSSPEDIAQVRTNYTAELNPRGIVIRQVPVAGEEPPAEGEAAAEVPGEAAAPGAQGEEEGSEPEPVATRTDVLLDIILHHKGADTLPGVTLDISEQGAGGGDKGHWLLYVDTSDLPRNMKKQITYTLTDVDYQEGDGFHVEVREHVPPEERGDYREFSPPAS